MLIPSIWLEIVILYLVSVNVSTRKLLLVQQIFRHGARNSQNVNPYDNSQISRQWRSQGQLTTQGKYMAYRLGKQIYKKYWFQLFGGTPYEKVYNQSKIYVKSTDVNRTIQTALSHLMGLFQNLQPLKLSPAAYQLSLPQWPDLNMTGPNDDWLIFGNSAPSYHPIAVHSERQFSSQDYQADFLLSSDADLCPKQAEYAQQNLASQLAKQIQSQDGVKKFIKALQQELDFYDINFENVDDFIDNFYVLKHLQIKYAKVFDDPAYSSTIGKFKITKHFFIKYYTSFQIKLGSSKLLRVILENMRKIIKDREQRQLIIYSGHDSTIAPLITSLNMTNVNCIQDYWINKIDNLDSCIVEFPQYLSNVIFQLWQQSENYYTLQVLYNGKPRKIPICGNKINCPFQEFENWVQSFVTDDYISGCGIQVASNLPLIIVFVAVIFTITSVFIIIVWYIKRQQMLSRQQLEPLRQN